MSQDDYDNILALLVTEDKNLVPAFQKLWKKYQQLYGATLYPQTPEIHVHCHCREQPDVQ